MLDYLTQINNKKVQLKSELIKISQLVLNYNRLSHKKSEIMEENRTNISKSFLIRDLLKDLIEDNNNNSEDEGEFTC